MTWHRALDVRFGLALGLWALTACTTLGPDPRDLKFEPIALTEATVTVAHLGNGIPVYLRPDPSLPLIRLRALIRAGSDHDIREVTALGSITAQQMRVGGAGDWDPDDLDEAMDFAAIKLSSRLSSTSARVAVDTLAERFPEALAYLAAMVREPRFDPDRLAISQKQRMEHLRRRNDHPGSVARREFRTLIYGPDHPRGRQFTADDLAAITRERLVAYHRAHYVPERMALGVTGDFDTATMIASLEAAFGDWQAQVPPLDEPPEAAVHEGRQVAFAHKPIDQVSVRMGHLTLRRTHPDYYALAMANRVLGASPFANRLFNRVRTERGLAYSVGSVLSAEYNTPGVFLMAVRTRSSQVAEAMGIMLEELDRIRTEPVSEADLAAAKEAFVNALVFRAVTPDQAVNWRMHLAYHDLPADERERWITATLALTPADLLRVAQTHLHPDRLHIFAVGDRDVLVPALSALGSPMEVVPVAYDAPTPSDNTPTSP